MTYVIAFQSVLEQLNHEDALLLARTQWLLISQTLLLVAYACLDANRLPAGGPRNPHRSLAVLGLTSTILIFAAILASLKVYVAVRSQMFALVAEHPDLPMRQLPRVGMGAGLLCPLFLALALICTWTRLVFSSCWSAALLTVAAAVISLSVIGGVHLFPTDASRNLFRGTMLTTGIALLVAAVWLGMRAMRGK